MPELDPPSNPLSRVELLRLAQGLGVVDADVMTRAELRAAIDKAQRPERPSADQQPVTWVSVARRLLASVVERGLNLPDAAALIRGDTKLTAPPKAPPPVATVTLARIYAAQGHLARAIGTLDEVLQSDPDHELARDLRDQLELRRAELAARHGHGEFAAGPPDEPQSGEPAVGEPVRSEAAEHDAAASAGTPPAGEDARSAAPPPVQSVDAAAELVAPAFATAEAPPPFPAEPPTQVGVAPPALEPPAAPELDRESEPPATLAAGVDWRSGNDAGNTDVVAEVEARVWTAADSADASAGPDPADWGGSRDAGTAGASADAHVPLASSGDAVASAALGDLEPGPGAAEAADALAIADGSVAGGTLSGGTEAVDIVAALEGDAAQPAVPSILVDGDAAQPPEPSAPLELDAARATEAPAATEIPPATEIPAATDVPAATDLPAAPEVPTITDAPVVTESPAAEFPAAEPPVTVPPAAEPPAATEAPAAALTQAPAAAAADAATEPPVADGASAAAQSPAEPPARDVPAPASVANGIAAAPAPSSPAPSAAAAPPLPRVPGLLLIETDTPIRYIYWELGAGGSTSPHWIHVVSHTPTGQGNTERRERCFPVHRQLGALRLEGVPRQAVVRAKLTHAPDDARPLVVAGAVRPRSLGGSESFEVRYAPHAKAAPEALAGRARPLLEHASPIYWDS